MSKSEKLDLEYEIQSAYGVIRPTYGYICQPAYGVIRPTDGYICQPAYGVIPSTLTIQPKYGPAPVTPTDGYICQPAYGVIPPTLIIQPKYGPAPVTPTPTILPPVPVHKEYECYKNANKFYEMVNDIMGDIQDVNEGIDMHFGEFWDAYRLNNNEHVNVFNGLKKHSYENFILAMGYTCEYYENEELIEKYTNQYLKDSSVTKSDNLSNSDAKQKISIVDTLIDRNKFLRKKINNLAEEKIQPSSFYLGLYSDEEIKKMLKEAEDEKLYFGDYNEEEIRRMLKKVEKKMYTGDYNEEDIKRMLKKAEKKLYTGDYNEEDIIRMLRAASKKNLIDDI